MIAKRGLSGIKQWFKKRFNKWLNQRIPAANEQSLGNRNIFIVPTKFGYAYVFSVLILFLLGTNYQNNLIILMSYLFASVFLTSMMYSFFNLSRLKFFFNSNVTAYATQTVSIPLAILSKKQRFDINFVFENNDKAYAAVINAGESDINVPFQAVTRGVNNPGRLKISSEYAFGLFVCWTHLDFSCEVLTYPEKKVFNHIKHEAADLHEELIGNTVSEGGDDFGELRQYKQGESNAKIAWKQLARGQGWLTKTTQQELGSTIWLTLQQLPSSPIETKLQMLCFLVLDHHKSNVPFGLELDNLKIEPSTGSLHIKNCLQALALYGKGKAYSSSNVEAEH
ncbi:DUF58 domain-containing protein [Pseudocolwellia sp. HL-MZ19]|uniref:DUF58 domain-containing protein n=1 Tax=Pseudocolwellia sp. HL-MZ19 TaxID=3400846 RepID=UPI003CF8AFC9